MNFSIILWTLCYKYNIPLVYASSAATYGDGKYGFDDEINIKKLKPLNLYGLSKQEFDLYILEFIDFHQSSFWVGLKFFNVYGYGESDKGRMASMIYHTYNQIKETGEVKLFKSYNDDYKDGEQLRDFIYVDDIVDVCINMMEKKNRIRYL